MGHPHFVVFANEKGGTDSADSPASRCAAAGASLRVGVLPKLCSAPGKVPARTSSQ